MSSQGLTCHEVVELVTDYLEGALPPANELGSRSTCRPATGARATSSRCARRSG